VAEKLRLYNTLSRKLEDFEPRLAGQVGLYSCGPTVYSYAHIGNMRSYIFADTLRRALETLGYAVTHVMNITDVGHLTDDADAGEDKLELGSRREGVTAWDIARKYTDAFFEHADKLNIKRPTVVCKATDFIPEQIAMIRTLEDKGYTYRTADGIYYDTSRFAAYTQLGRLDVEGLREGARVDVGEKRHKTDFALWKFSKPGDVRRQMEWDSPWGRGFPGWHLECSAMSIKFLGEQFDIHTGGVDHIPIHHTNEIAQSEAATGKTPFVRYWLHGEFLVIDDAEKMSKSLGNVLTVATLEERGYNPLAYRLLVLQTHYRKQLHFSLETLAAAQRGYERLNQQVLRLKGEAAGNGAKVSVLQPAAAAYRRSFREALANDLGTPQILATLHGLLEDQLIPAGEKLALVAEIDQTLGLDLFQEHGTSEVIPAELEELLRRRNEARSGKSWAEADRLRQEIADRGYEILDSVAGSTLKRKL